MERLLAIIAGGSTSGYLEVRYSLPGRGMAQQFHTIYPNQTMWRANLRAAITSLSADADVFIGASPRATKHGGRAAVPRTWALWVDCDDAASTARLAEFQPRPTLTIASGSPDRVHAWWQMASPLPALHAERANRRLAHHLGADPRCAEVARIMRPPQTLNHKTTPPSPVTVLEHNPGTVSVVMAADLPDPNGRPLPRRRFPAVVRKDGALDTISALEYIPRLTGREPDAKGYVQCPFHEDWNPSLMAYEDPRRGWRCFQCDTGGDVYTFGSLLWDMPTTGAAFVQLKDRLSRELL